MTHLRSRLLYPMLALMGGTALAVAQAPAPAGLRAMDHPDVRAISGSWDLEAASGRKCRMQLNPKGPRADLVLGLPTACKATFPRLTGATSWALAESGEIVLLDTARKELMRFKRKGDGPMEAGNGEERFTLASVTGRYPSTEKTQAIKAATGASPPTIPPATVPGFAPVRITSGQITSPARPASPVAAPSIERVPGTYAVLRYAGREVCRLVLDAKPSGKPGLMQARFAGSCTETGMATFDPMAWKMENGRLTLIARKGHEVKMVYDLDGMWRKDPPSGATLLLNKVGP